MNTTVDNLLEFGYLDLDSLLPTIEILETLRLRLRKTVSSIKSIHPLHTSRRAWNLPIQKLGKGWFQQIFSPELVTIIHSVLPKGAFIHGVSEIECPAGTASQHTHRDHEYGDGMSLVVAISLDGNALKTELQPESHLEHIPPCTARGAMELDRLEREKKLIAMGGQMMIYDPHIMHRGGENTTEDALTNRVFIMMVSADTPKAHIKEINETNATVGYKGMLLSALLSNVVEKKKNIKMKKTKTKKTGKTKTAESKLKRKSSSSSTSKSVSKNSCKKAKKKGFELMLGSR
jgi:hypothetical protein